MQKILILFVLLLLAPTLSAQDWVPAPADTLQGTVYLMNGTVHVGNGKVIPNGVVGIENGKITLVADATTIRLNLQNAKTINCYGKQIYPGLITPNSTLGLIEIGAVRATNDLAEVGDFTPNVRSLIAYNAESVVIPTVRSNGILLAQSRPFDGTISGSSSIMQLDAWNWEDAVVKSDDGMWMQWPSYLSRSGWWAEPGELKPNEKFDGEVQKISQYFAEAQAYCKTAPPVEPNLVLEAMCDMFSKNQKVYIAANHAKEIISAVNFAQKFGLDMVLVGGRDSYLLTDLLKEYDIPVMLFKTHQLPYLDDNDVAQSYKLPKILQDAGILYCITAENDSGEQRNLPFTAGKAVGYGLTEEQALAAITANTAKILGIDADYGTLESGKSATIIVSEGDVLDVLGNNIVHAFIDGREISLDNKQKELYHKYMKKYDLPPKE
ncbi:MAG: amidohydrolase family protein [Chitinophagales bacterium]|nr:amidohydrolase family protein [Bacteroidota bacterium]MCB9043407.1 amidohydrolase family protein [Chitinophagales bacterium]